MRKNIKQDIFKNKKKISSKFNSNFYTWIRIQQIKLMLIQIRNPVNNGKRSRITVSHGKY
jgi:hypothetical protein